MADPKYANLPGIVHDQPDVYETEDLPESDQYINFEADEENYSIDRFHLNPELAIEKFLGSVVDGSKVDFSNPFTALRRRGYDVRNEWELSGTNQVESNYQKFLRLKCEIAELVEDVTKSGQIMGGGETFTFDHCVSEMKEMERQLLALHIEEGPKNKNSEFESKITSNLQQIRDDPKSSLSPLQYDLCLSGTKTNESGEKSPKLCEMEARVARLEKVLGSDKKDKLNTIAKLPSNQSVLGSISLLNSKLSLLEPKNVDMMETSLGSILKKVDGILAKKLDVEEMQKSMKLGVLYEMIEESSGMIQALPGIMERLNALKTLHETAANFVTQLNQIENSQESLQTSSAQNEKLLRAIQDALNQVQP